MELPIRIIIILFVSIVVGGMMIVFTQQTFDRAGSNLRDQEDLGITEDRIIKTDSITTKAMEGLLKQCYEENNGVNFVETPCFAIFADTPFTLSTVENFVPGNNFTVDISDASLSAMSITFNPFGKIIISG